MKPKMGRPVLPKGEAKGVLIGARFSPDEANKVHAAIRREKLVKSEWVRKTLLSAAGGSNL
jgi:hypothetical protein